jgi:ribosome-associated toxin RatA of RatAB toxin-antitoxin module
MEGDELTDRVRDTIDVTASVDDLFEIVSDYGSYPEWQPNIKRVEVKEVDPEGRATLVWYEVDAVVKKVQYSLSYDYSNAPNSLTWTMVEGDIGSLDGSYGFEEFDDVTEVAYELAIDPGFKVPALLRRRAQRQIVSGALKDLKKRAEAGE